MRSVLAKYLRVSSEDINLDGIEKFESNSIANQRAYLDDFISNIPEFAECDIIELVDDGRTGTNFNRPGVINLLNLAEHGKIQCIIVKDLSRFGRNFLEVGDYIEQKLPALGVRFISVNDMYDSAKLHGTTGGIDIAFRNLIYEMYSHDLSSKVRSAKVTINKGGKSTASYAFFGYKKDPDDRHKFIIDEPAAEIVRLIFNLREQGLSCGKIAKKLNADGIITSNARQRDNGARRSWLRNGKSNIWDPGRILPILHDERYTGKHIYGKKARIELGKPIVQKKPKSDWIIVPDTIPAIISAEQFERVQKQFREANNRKDPKSAKVVKPAGIKPLFQHKLFCGGCGRGLRRFRSGGDNIYRCFTRHIANDTDCVEGSISERCVKDAVLTSLRQQINLASTARSFQKANEKSTMPAILKLECEVQNLQRLTEKTRIAKMALWENYHSGSISLDMYHNENVKLDEQASSYEAKSADLKEQSQKLESNFGIEDTFTERFCGLAGINELTQDIINEFIKAIYVYAADRIEIVFNYSDQYAKNLMLTRADN